MLGIEKKSQVAIVSIKCFVRSLQFPCRKLFSCGGKPPRSIYMFLHDLGCRWQSKQQLNKYMAFTAWNSTSGLFPETFHFIKVHLCLMILQEGQQKTDLLHEDTKEQCVFTIGNENLLMNFEVKVSKMHKIQDFVAQPCNLMVALPGCTSGNCSSEVVHNHLSFSTSYHIISLVSRWRLNNSHTRWKYDTCSVKQHLKLFLCWLICNVIKVDQWCCQWRWSLFQAHLQL